MIVVTPALKTHAKLRRCAVWSLLLLTVLLAAAWAGRKVVRHLVDQRTELHAAHAKVNKALVRYAVAPSHPKILLNHAATLNHLTQSLQRKSAPAVRFQDMVDAHMAGREQYGFQPWFAALLFRMNNDALYAVYAIQQTDALVAAEEALINQNRAANVAADSYLQVGETIGNVALVYDWCYDRLTPAQRARWLRYANQSVWNVWHHTQARWGDKVYPWTGWSVNNPSNNYYYSFLRATMLLGLASHGENDQAQHWLDVFRENKLEAQLFPTFDRDLSGGGSREGTGYGAAMTGLFQLLDWWERSTGERLATRTPHTLACMAHMLHSTTPTLNQLAPTGDHSRDSSAALFDYHREYLLELMALFPQEQLSGVAKSLLAASSVKVMQHGYNAYVDLLYGEPNLPARPLTELASTYWGAGTGQLMMRSAWTAEPNHAATYANFICGPYTESHAHRDQGSFVIHRGDWLAGDANAWSHSGIEQAEALHNLVRFELAGLAVRQSTGSGCELKGLVDNAFITWASASVTPVYQRKPGVNRVEREFLFIKPSTFVVLDRTVTGLGTRRIWTLNLPGRPVVQGKNFHLDSGVSRLNVMRLSPEQVKTEVVSWNKVNPEVLSGFRVDVENSSAAPFLHVLSTAAAATNTTASEVKSAVRDDGSAEQIGARIQLADGREALVRFHLHTLGGSLTLTTQSGEVLHTAVQAMTVQKTPLFANMTNIENAVVLQKPAAH
jgi:hypothetical protein